jgi:DNA-binding transcriptional ArsR family regulator
MASKAKKPVVKKAPSKTRIKLMEKVIAKACGTDANGDLYDIITLLKKRDRPMSVTNIRLATCIPATTLRRKLATLMEAGIVEKIIKDRINYYVFYSCNNTTI